MDNIHKLKQNHFYIRKINYDVNNVTESKYETWKSKFKDAVQKSSSRAKRVKKFD